MELLALIVVISLAVQQLFLKEVRRLILELHENPIHAVNMASLNPAKRFGVDDELGSIAIGKKS